MVLYDHKEVTNMKQVIYVTTSEEAYIMAHEIINFNNEAVIIAENEYKSDKHFKGVMIYVKE